MILHLKSKRKYLLALADAVVIACSCLLSYFLITAFLESDASIIISLNIWSVLQHSAILLLCNLIGLFVCRVYQNIWRYATIKDFSGCICGIVFGTLTYYIVTLVCRMESFDIYTMMSNMFSMLGIIILRGCYYYMYSRISQEGEVDRHRTLIVGAGRACNKILLEMQDAGSKYKAVGIVDDDPSKQKRCIRNVPVLGKIKDIPKLAEQLHTETILFAIPSCTAEEKRRILNICSETVCEVKTVPYLHELVMNADLLGQAQSINIEDLLGRDVVKFDDFAVGQMITDKKCMVTGGGGSIGSELCRQIAKYNPKKLIIVDIYENNAYEIQQELMREYSDKLDLEVQIASVRDYDKMKLLFEEFRPELVFHAAAHKHVPLMETNPEEAVKNNVLGTFNTASLSNEYKVKKFVLVSTDKAVNPTNVMGATKRCCEMIAQYFAQKSDFTEFVAVRFGNVLGSNGSVIPLFEKQLDAGGPLTVTHPDIIRYFMTIPEAVSLILQAGTIAHGGEIFVLDMGEPVKILSLAENLIRLHGKEPYTDIQIKFTGLRPGEKLFEELLMDEEGLRETPNRKIFIGKQIELDEKEFLRNIERLRNVAAANDADGVVSALREIVPTFNHVVINN